MKPFKLDILPEHFNLILDGTKPFEVRREFYKTYHVGEVLLLEEFVPRGYYEDTGEEYYTGNTCHMEVTYKFEMEDGWVVLGLRAVQ